MNPSTTKLTDQIKISIGLPVFNGEKSIQRCLDSLLTQTFTNFELIISDNASMDSTPIICEKYAKKDKRIRYIRQEKNNGLLWNFNFVLKEAKYDYFVWAAADDYVLPDFLKKNIEVLVSDNNLVGSVSRIKQYGMNELNSNLTDVKFRNFVKSLRLRFRKRDTYSISGTYQKRVRTYLKKSTCQIIYGVFRTEKLRKSIIYQPFIGMDWAEVLSVLKYGNFHIIDEVLMYESDVGISSRGIIDLSLNYNPNSLAVIFPWYPFTCWCVKNLGIKIFLQNLDFFIRLNYEGIISQIIDLIRILVHKLPKN